MDEEYIRNQSTVNAFILLGFKDYPGLQLPLFVILLMVFVMTIIGNMAIIYIVVTDSHLHSPMYTFLRNLAFLEMCYISVTVPKMLTNYVIGIQTISFHQCFIQIYFLHFFGSIECFTLCFMALDRLAAICYPLRYSTLMSQSTCCCLLVLSSTVAFVDAALHTVLTSKLPFCGSTKVWNFFCDVPPLLIIACSDTAMNEALLKTAGGIVGFGTALVIVISYACIIATILSMKTTNGKWKPFSTCSSHITVLTLFYGSGLFTYTFQNSNSSPGSASTLSLGYSVITPFLNPIIYSLRNKEIKQAMAKVIQTITFPSYQS